MTRLRPGELVRYTSAFLRSAGWYTDVPIDGKVLEVEPEKKRVSDTTYVVTVQWCDRDAPIRVLSCNIERLP